MSRYVMLGLAASGLLLFTLMRVSEPPEVTAAPAELSQAAQPLANGRALEQSLAQDLSTAAPLGLAEGELVASEDEYLFDAQARQAAYWQQQLQAWRSLQGSTAPPEWGNGQALMRQLVQHCVERACREALEPLWAQLTAAEAAHLQQLLASWQDYEQQLQQLELSTQTSPQSRYEQVQALREQFFAEQQGLLFAQEEQFAAQQWRFNDLLAEAASLSVEQRLAAFDHWQQQTLALSPPDLFGQEQAYQQGLLLLQDLPAEVQAHYRTQLQQQLFLEQWPVIAEHEQRLAEQHQQQQAYQQALQALQDEWLQLLGSLAEVVAHPEYQQALVALRLVYFPPS